MSRNARNRPSWKLLGVALAVALALAACRPAVIEGTDQGFGSNGMVSTAVSSQYSGGQVTDLAVQTDGKIVAVGELGCSQCNAVAGVARFNPNGTVDNSFAHGGKLTFNWLGCCDATATSVVVQPDGKILVGGGVHYCCVLTNDSLGVVRLNSNGSFDQTFGTNGKVTTSLAGPVTSSISDIALQADGKIVAVASTGASNRTTVVRYQANGKLDPTFGTGGIAQPNSNECDTASSVAIDAAGRIVIGGTGWTCDGSGPDSWFDVARLQTNGQPDPTFGTNGLVQTGRPPTTNSESSTGRLTALALQSDGRIVAVGAGLVRYNPDGTLDSSFGGTGIVHYDSRMGTPQAVGIRADGTIVTANSSGGDGFVAVQWRPDGTYEIPTVTQVGATSAADAIAVQPDGKIIAGGYSSPETASTPGTQFALVRFPAERTTPTIVAPQGRQVAKPVEAYAPLVYLYPGEEYKPMDATQYINQSSLWWDVGKDVNNFDVVTDCGTVLQGATHEFDLSSLGHGAYFHPFRGDTVTEGPPDCNPGSHERASDQPSNPGSTDIGLGVDEGYYLDYGGDLGGTGTSAPVYFDYQDRHYIAYWFFYAYNKGGVPLTGCLECAPSEGLAPPFDNHDGDWENITVRLNCNDEPIGVDYFAHGGSDHIDDWPGREATPSDPGASSDTLNLVPGTNHPVTFSAFGTHAWYATAGTHDLGYSINVPGIGDVGALDYTAGGSDLTSIWHTEQNLIPLSTQPWYGYDGAWGYKSGAEANTWGPSAPHYPDKTGAPADWDGPCVPAR